jgi:hypothetical protein
MGIVKEELFIHEYLPEMSIAAENLPRQAATVIKNKLPLPPPRLRRGSGSAAMDISGMFFESCI